MAETPDTFQPSPIRFRVWTGTEMIYPEDLDRSGSLVLPPSGVLCDARVLSDGSGIILSASDGVAMLSTGLHDAEGTEVFEGDDIEWKTSIYRVENVLGCFGISTKNGWKVLGLIAAGFPEMAHTSEVRVVGHAFEPARTSA